MTVNHYPMPFRFRVNGASDHYLEHGHAVLVAFHPGKPEQGCHVFNAETGTRNRDGLKFGELLLVAPIAEDAPQFSLSRDEQDAFARRRRAAAAVRSEFRAIVPAGRVAARISTARDGRGNSAVVEKGAVRQRTQSRSLATDNPVNRADSMMQKAIAANHAGRLDWDEEAARLACEDREREALRLPE